MKEQYALINTTQQMAEVMEELREASSLAIDVEFDNKYNYQTVICLVQVASSQHTFLIDPFAVDMSIIQSIFEDPEVIKIFFAGIQDIQLLQSQFGWQIRSIVDLSAIYQLLNDDNNQTSLNDVIEDVLHITVPKNKRIQKREDWKQRPIPQAMRMYAARDVIYLHRALVELQHHLSTPEQQLLELYFRQLPFIEPMVENTLMYGFDLCGRYNIRAIQDRYLMYELVQFREQIAEMTNQSSGYILSKSMLKKLVMYRPTSIRKLKHYNLYYNNMKKYANDVINIIRNSSYQEGEDRLFEHLHEQYHTYYPYHEFLNRQNQWPCEVSIQHYRNRRGMLRVLKAMIEDRFGGDINYLFTRYLQHQVARFPSIRLDVIRQQLEETATQLEIFKIMDVLISKVEMQLVA